MRKTSARVYKKEIKLRRKVLLKAAKSQITSSMTFKNTRKNKTRAKQSGALWGRAACTSKRICRKI